MSESTLTGNISPQSWHSAVCQCAFFHTMVLKDKDQMEGDTSPSSSSVCEVRAYLRDDVSRSTRLICCVIWLTPSHYKLDISSVNMHPLTESWPKRTPRAEVTRTVKEGLFLFFVFLCVPERDEASTDSSDHNSTSFTEVDKRVKRRLLMGNKSAPVFIGVL